MIQISAMLRLFLFSSGSSIILTYIAMILATRYGIYDMPDVSRKIHHRAVPLLGGPAVFSAYAFALFLNFSFSWELKWVVISSFFIMLSGLVDDVRGLSAGVRMVVQFLCALMVISSGVCLDVIPRTVPYSEMMNILITVIWIVGITNAMNFMDGADGLAGGLAFIASVTFFVIAYQTGQSYFAYLNLAMAGACLGFLLFNFHPARIFLGDAGSAFLGFSLASMAVMGEWSEGMPIVSLSIPLLVLAVLIFDMIYISVSRVYYGKVRSVREWIEYVGRDHLHHRLMGLGLTHVQTVVFVYMISLVFALGALVLKKAVTMQAVLLVIQAAIVLVIVSVLMIVGRRHMEKTILLEERMNGTVDGGRRS